MRKIKSSFPWFASFFTLISLLILTGLGTWQIQRLAWKNDLMASLETEYKKNGLEYPLNLRDLIVVSKDTPLKGSITGQFDYSNEIKIGPRGENSVLGYDIFTPFYLKTGGVVLVDRGWVKSSDSNQKSRLQSHARGEQTLTGIARIPSRPWKIGPENIPSRDVWIYPSPTQVAQSKNILKMAPSVFHLETSSNAKATLSLSNERWQPRNNHLQYAIFWFAMAGVLAVIYWVRFLKK